MAPLSPFAEWEMQSMDGSIGGGGVTELFNFSPANHPSSDSPSFNTHVRTPTDEASSIHRRSSVSNPSTTSPTLSSSSGLVGSSAAPVVGNAVTAGGRSHAVGGGHASANSKTFTASLSTVTATASQLMGGEKSDGSPPGTNMNAPNLSSKPWEGGQFSSGPVSVSTAGAGADAAPSIIFTNSAFKFRPCDLCRRRKARCIRLQGSSTCETCAARNQTCTFVQGPRPRKKPKKEERAIPAPTVKISSSSPADSKKRSFDEAHQEQDDLIKDVGPIKDYASMEGHSLLKKTMSLQFPRSSFYIGSTSVYDSRLFDRGALDKLDQAKLAGDIYVRRPAPDIYFTLNNDDSVFKGIADVDAVERVVAPHGRALIDLYFRIVHPSLPILAKKVFLEKYNRTHREFSPPLLAAVYILALNWWYYDPQLSSHPKPDVNKLHYLANRTFSRVLDHPKLSSVQAGLLLMQCRPNNSRNWGLCCQVTALAEELGLGLNCQNWRLPKWERALRKRVAWAVFLQDKWLSLIEARPSHIDKKNWMVRALTLDEFPDTPEEVDDPEALTNLEDGKLLFIEMINLGEIVSEIMDALFTFQAKNAVRNTESILNKAKPIQIKLKQWYQNLSPSLRMVNSKPRRLSSNGYLHLAYFAAEITLHRRIIRSLTASSSPEIVRVCRAAAKERLVAAMEFVKSLRPEHIQAFWHFSAPANFAVIGTFAAVLYITSTSPDESAFYKTQLSDCLWTMRISSGFQQMTDALQMLTVAISGVPGLQLLETDNKKDDDDHAENEYSEEDSYEDAIHNDIGDDDIEYSAQSSRLGSAGVDDGVKQED